MLRTVLTSSSGDAALSRFGTTNTWPATQTFSVSAIFSGGLISSSLAQFTSSSTTVGGIVTRATGTISANPAGYANCAFQSVGAQATTANNMFDSAGGVVQLVFRRRNGTYSAQTAVLNNETIGQLDWQGHDGTTVRTQCQILGFAIENFTSTANGTAMSFATTATGTTTLATRLTLTSTTATFSVDTVQSNASVNNSAGTNRSFQWLTGGSPRWVARANATSETGSSNAGSDFEIRRYSDAGADLGLAMAINRANGNIFLNQGGGRCYFQGTRTDITSTVNIIDSTGTNRSLRFTDGNVANRWALIANSTAESGSNAGTNFELRRYSDAGADLGLVMAVTRSTGDITFNGGGGKTTFSANAINISTAQSPPSGTSGTTGDLAWDDTYLYGRTSTGWKRIAWVAY